ncbi:MAG TPA: single-stranded DNA-binding protein [Bacillales bacterium]|nr:single-stranded DNA-binding protein [Bacillales bacterium]
MINRTVLVGRLTKDPELRYTPNGVAVASFTLACDRPFTNQQGEREADFIRCVVWRRPAENVANYLQKGSLAGVDGRIQTRSFDNNEGRRVFVSEVVADRVQFLEPKGSSRAPGQGPTESYGGGNQNPNRNQNQSPYGDDPFAGDGKPIDISDDDLPF